MLEEIELGTVIGTVQAVDSDEGENAVVEYAIVGKLVVGANYSTVPTVA